MYHYQRFHCNLSPRNGSRSSHASPSQDATERAIFRSYSSLTVGKRNIIGRGSQKTNDPTQSRITIGSSCAIKLKKWLDRGPSSIHEQGARRSKTHYPILGLGQPPRQRAYRVGDVSPRAMRRGRVEYPCEEYRGPSHEHLPAPTGFDPGGYDYMIRILITGTHS